MEVAKDFAPDTIVCIGDLADFYAVSSHSKDPGRRLTFKEEVEYVRLRRGELDELGASRKLFLEGNHEYRLTRFLMDKAPALFGTVGTNELLELSANGWEFTKYRDHARVGKVHFTHDTGHAGRYAAFRSLDTYQHSVITGHTHRLAYIVEGNATGENKLSAQFGWLGDVNQVDYLHRATALKSWAMGFGIGYEDTATGHIHFQPVPIIEYRCVVQGKLWKAPRRRKG